ncbi:GNAT family N-acetyltransferase [Marivita sp. GX14005]|uniref:GNAT family N-acetyltransferase n=1 Tax=Marivita sp. GX14005 TaxID=2942276 RepID=UPI002018E667|nr:GNAT family N-acetyltransferase [Marivita sp. GX14005]MCL3881846.1 GNAT family N-acetyltransferase [Marivita sp. GX14005]
MTPDIRALYAAADATWPPAERIDAGPWMLRNGAGGGKRVSAATAESAWRADDLAAAEAAMRLLGQAPLFMIREGEADLDLALEARGYAMIDPVDIWWCPLAKLTDLPIPRVTAFALWEPLAVMRDIWQAGGIDDARIAVMERAAHPKTSIFGRIDDKPAGAAFCAIHAGIALVHAIEIASAHRRKGLAAWMIRRAAFWAAENGANSMAVLCKKANDAAIGLYTSLDMQVVGQYHYRIQPNSGDLE